MSIKKFGQGGEYLHFSDKKKFIPAVFFAFETESFFSIFTPKNLEKSKTKQHKIMF